MRHEYEVILNGVGISGRKPTITEAINSAVNMATPTSLETLIHIARHCSTIQTINECVIDYISQSSRFGETDLFTALVALRSPDDFIKFRDEIDEMNSADHHVNNIVKKILAKEAIHYLGGERRDQKDQYRVESYTTGDELIVLEYEIPTTMEDVLSRADSKHYLFDSLREVVEKVLPGNAWDISVTEEKITIKKL